MAVEAADLLAEGGQGFADGLDGIGGQRRRQVALEPLEMTSDGPSYASRAPARYWPN